MEEIEQAREYIQNAIMIFVTHDLRSELIDEAIANLEDADWNLKKEQELTKENA